MSDRTPLLRRTLRRSLVLVGLALVIVASAACQPTVVNPKLLSGTTLASGKSLTSNAGRNVLTMQTDGNLVLRINGTAMWSTKTAGNSGAELVMNTTGALAVVSTDGTTLWATPTGNATSAYAQLGDDGNFVVRGSQTQPLWANGISTAPSTRTTASLRHISTQQVTLTKMYEGYLGKLPYNDVFNHCTVGYGHLIHLGPCTDTDKAKTYDPDALFASDVLEHERRLKSSLGTVPMSQREFDALFDYVFNRGSLTATNSPNTYAAMTDSPPRYADVPGYLEANGRTLIRGLCNRRYDEADTFRGGGYDRSSVCPSATPPPPPV